MVTLLFTAVANGIRYIRAEQRWKEGEYKKQLEAFAKAEMIRPPRAGHQNLHVVRAPSRWSIRAWLNTDRARASKPLRKIA